MVRMIYTIVWLVGCLLLGLSFAWSASVSGVGGGAAQGLGGNFNISGGNIITGASESKQLRFLDSGGTNGGTMYWHSSGKLVITCVVANVEGACDIYPELNAGKKWGIKRASDGAIMFDVDGNTGALTATIDCSSATVHCTVYNTETFEMAGCQAGVAGGIWNTTAAGTPTFACDPDNSNIVGAYASFDPSIDKFVDINLRLPAGYVSGSLEFIWHWKTAGTTGTSVFCAQTGRVTTGLTSNPTLAVRSTGNGNCVSSTAQAVSLAENRVTNFNPLCTGCSGGDELKVRLSRDAAGTVLTDSLTSAAHVMKVVARWRELQ